MRDVLVMTALFVGVMAGIGYGGQEASISTNTKPNIVTTVKGTCDFGGKQSTWTAKLTAKGDGTYEAHYDSTWGGQPVTYAGTVKTDGKTEISGMGKATGGRGNGSFEFSGKYGHDGVAKCAYKEVGGRGRSGSMTAEKPSRGDAEAPAKTTSAAPVAHDTKAKQGQR